MAGFGLCKRMEQRAAIDHTLAVWAGLRTSKDARAELRRAGIPAAALATARDLVNSDHLNKRGFWDAHGAGVLPGLPWRASFGRTLGAAPELGADTDRVLNEVLDLTREEIAGLRGLGAFGPPA
jgi:crotonobetainyl-CoA:carnitine CoA-transferase CaiB-like acyl-CoA transferase